MICRICTHNNLFPEILKNNDKMFQSKELFDYFVCENCESLQIVSIPQNVSEFYPKDYYSFSSHISIKEKIIFSIRDWLLFLKLPSFLIKKINKKFPNLALSAFLKVMRNKSATILDVGCGEGKFLKSIYQLGFENCRGIDPFISQEQKNPFPIEKKELSEINQKFDIICFHHVFEHLENVNQTLEKCQMLLNKNGKIIIRVPVKDSFAFETYKENWVQWDAPRHFQLLTKKAFEILAQNNGFVIHDYYGDSYKFQFTGSEKYKRGKSYQTSNAIFTKTELNYFTKKSIELNKSGQADQVVVVLGMV